MFVIIKKTDVTWPIEYRQPKDGGGVDTHTFGAKYKVPDQDEIDSLFKMLGQARRNELSREEAERIDADVVAKYFLGWDEEVKQPDGTPFENNVVNRKMFLLQPGMRATLVEGFFKMLAGVERKNSKGQPSTG